MLITISNNANTPTVKRLIEVWAQRYVPDLSSVAPEENTPKFRQHLIKKTALQGRIETASKITRRVVAIKCQMASLQAKSLYAYFPSVLTFSDTHRLSDFALLIYLKLAEIYQQPSVHTANEIKIQATSLVNPEISEGGPAENTLSMRDWGMPAIEQLAAELEPLLLEFQQQHILSEDKRTLGFLTTLLNFCNELILQGLPLAERLLIYPYFKFVEEQVALPWQRVCLAASRHSSDSLTFTTVESCLPQAQIIAQRTYLQLKTSLPRHRSRRGLLSHSGIIHSTVRDLQMNQAYFWLAVLEGTLSAVEQELLPLCTMVFPAIGVSWELIALSNQILFDELVGVMNPAQADHILPVIQDYMQAFNQRQADFQEIPAGVRKEALATSPNPLTRLEQLQSQQTFSAAAGGRVAGEHQPPQSADSLSQASDVNRLKAKMARLEAELLDTHQQLNTLLPEQNK